MGLLDKLGSVFSSKKKDFNLVVIGLDNAGKSTIVNGLKSNNKANNITPTVGFNMEKFSVKSLNFTTYDMSGQSRYRNLWEAYYREADAIVFVVDSGDRMRFVVASEEIISMLEHPEIKNKKTPLLVYANKRDVKGAVREQELSRELQLDSIRSRPWAIFATNGLEGEGIAEGIEWLVQKINSQQSN
jgi:ADP-ribosylation factor-like protein 6